MSDSIPHFFKELFQYHYLFNKKFFQVFDQYKDKNLQDGIKLMCHILNAHHIWNHRILHTIPQRGVWDVYEPAVFTAINNDNHEQTLSILSNQPFNSLLTYTNSKGQAFSNTVQDILFHVINHTTYHKAQIATLFRSNGIEPLVMDYIVYKR